MRRCLVVMVAMLVAGLLPAAAAMAEVDPLSTASGPTPFAPDCNGAPQTGTLYPNAEVEPWVSVNQATTRNLIGVWQQDRWSNGGAQGLLTGVSRDGGQAWTRPLPPPFTRCAGGSPRNGGDYERASDPWVSFGPDGTAFQISISFDDSDAANAILVSRSRDGGSTWGPISTLIRDDELRFFNDKESITADPTNPRYAYAIWDRLDQPDPNDDERFFGPTYLARTTNGGATWERARSIFDPGVGNQTIGNQIVVLPNGDLLNAFDLILGGALNVAVQRSTDKGTTWSDPLIVEQLGTLGVVDPRTGEDVRTGDIIPEVAVDPRPGSNAVYLVWQDARFNGGRADQIAFSRSTDGGRTWSVPTRVSENADTQAFTASVHADADGNVGVTYYDFTSDTTASEGLATDAWFTRSRNGGRTWSARERLTPASFDMRKAPNAGGFFVGDYEGLGSAGRRFKPLFVATTEDAANPTDVFATTVKAPFGGAPAAAPPAGERTPSTAAPRSAGRVDGGTLVRRR